MLLLCCGLLWELVADADVWQVLVGAAWSSCTGYDGRWGQVVEVLHHEDEKYWRLLQWCYTPVQAMKLGSSLCPSDDILFDQV